MDKQVVWNWFRRRPWLIVPVFALIPWVGILLANQLFPQSPGRSEGPAPIAAESSAPIPAIAVSPVTPQATPRKPSPVPSVAATPKATPHKTAIAPRHAAVTAVQPAVNLSVDAAIQMRVLIHKGAAMLPVGTSTGGGIFDARTNKLVYQLPARSTYEMRADGDSIVIGSVRLPSLVWVNPSATGVTYVGDRAYRGNMLVVGSNGGLWVVNYVNMQQYLYSVVGSEVSPSWPMAALKAQAVAARSYALTYHLKPVKQDLFDLGADEYYQVYKGIESEADTTRQAVNGTSGEFVSYRGGVVESLYAATDDIVMEAFQGKGMSQIGALNLAEQGHTYRQILSAYYTGTGVARIEMDIE